MLPDILLTSIVDLQINHTVKCTCNVTSASKAARRMDKQQQRFFKIIGIDTETAWRVYQIPPIDICIDEQRVKCVERMLEDPDHPITLQTSKKGRENTRSSSFVPSRCNTKRYNNSTLQKTGRTIRDGNSTYKKTKQHTT
jgi:hypothetical protein